MTCKRNPEKLPGSCRKLKSDAEQFLSRHSKFNDYKLEYVAISTEIPKPIARDLTAGTRNFLANVVYAAAALSVVTISSSVFEVDAG